MATRGGESGTEQRRVILSPFQFALPDHGDLRPLRDQAGLTQKEVAEELGVARNTVSMWERGEWSPTLETLNELLALYRAEIARNRA